MSTKKYYEVKTDGDIVWFDAYTSINKFIKENHKIFPIESIKMIDGDLGNKYNPLCYTVKSVPTKSIIGYESLTKPVYMYRILCEGKRVGTAECYEPRTKHEIIMNYIRWIDDLPF